MEKKEFNKILIIQTAFLGDVILATPLIEKLHMHFPEASIDFILKKGNESLLSDHPYLNEVITLDKKNKLKSLQELIRKVQSKKYDLAVNLHRFASSGIIMALSGAAYKTGFNKNPFSFLYTKKIKHLIGEKAPYRHEVQRNLELVKDITDDTFLRPKLYLSPGDEDVINTYTRKEFVTISPASIWFTKQFPSDKWIELIRKISEKHEVYLLGAESDKSLCEEIRKRSYRDNVINLAGTLTILQSAGLMAKAKLNYVNDSAPMHLASAMNAPVCAVYCSTLPEFGFGPLSDFSKIVQINYDLYCRPCSLHGRKACPEGHFKCAKDIEISGLADLLEQTG